MGIYGVDDVGFDGAEIICGELSLEDDDLGGVDRGAVAAGEDLDALGGGVGALVELAGEVFDAEGGFVFSEGEVVEHVIDLGFGEDVGRCFVELGVGDAVDFVALDETQGFQVGQGKGECEVVEKFAGLVVVAGFFLNENAVHSCRIGERRGSYGGWGVGQVGIVWGDGRREF